MIIGFDIDDVIFDTSGAMRNILGEIKDEELIAHKLDVMRGDVSIPAVAKFLKKYLIVAVKEGKAKPGVADFPGTVAANEKALKDAGIEYDKIIYDSANKVDACRANGVEIFVDDSPKNCTEVKHELGIPVIGFESEITRDSLREADITSVDNWQDLEKKLLEYIKQL